MLAQGVALDKAEDARMGRNLGIRQRGQEGEGLLQDEQGFSSGFIQICSFVTGLSEERAHGELVWRKGCVYLRFICYSWLSPALFLHHEDKAAAN